MLIKLSPNAAAPYFNLGDTCIDLCDFHAAVDCFRRSLQLDATFVPAYSGLGGALFEQGEYEAAIRAFDRAIELKPDDPNARFSRSLVRLLLGDFEPGWADHEWRKRTAHKYGERDFAQPIWQGEPFAGRTLFLHHEQGFGDTIQALRYVPRIKALGGRVIVGCQPPLARLVQSVRGVDGIVSVGSDLPAFDLHAPLMSMPAIFGTNLQSIPADVPYVEADPSRVEEFRRLVGHSDEVKVGIVWQGSSIHRRDRLRSFSPSHFTPIAEVPNVRLISLQKGERSEQLVDFGCSFAIADLAREIGDFSDLAAAMRALDLVISCDSAPAHLAGALGVPVWIAVPFVPDWRWLLNRDDSPWYPSARLFRQLQRGTWAGVFERMAAALAEMVVRRRKG